MHDGRRGRLARSLGMGGAALAVLLAGGLVNPDVQAAVLAGGADRSSPFDAAPLLQARALRGLRAEVAAMALHGAPGGELPIEVLAVTVPAALGSASVPVFVEIDGAVFLEHHRGDLARLEVYIYAIGPDQGIADFVAEAFAVDVPGHGERIWQSGLEFFAQLDLPAGSYSLRVLVKDFQSKAYGLRSVALQVPAFDGGLPRVLTPLVADPAGRDAWLPVRSWRNLSDASGYSLAPMGLGLNPAVRPVLAAGRTVDLVVPISTAVATAGGIRVEFLADDLVRTSVPAEVIDRWKSPLEGLDLVSLRVPLAVSLLGDLAPGRQRVRVRFDAPESDLVSPTVDWILADAGVRQHDLIWSDLRGLLDPAAASARAPARGKASAADQTNPNSKRATRLRSSKARETLSHRYRGVLARLAAGTREAARGGLFDLESGALDGSDPERRDNLLAAELDVAAGLGKKGSELLVPLVLLHSEMYERYRGRRRYDLLAHTLDLLEQMVDLYAASGGSAENAADMLSSFAAIKLDANLISAGRRLFGRALEFDSANPAALLGLAATYEKYGQYSEALNQLELLALAAPDLDEGRLRLAITLDRVGLKGRARALLEALLEGGDSDWVRAVAAEEAGRMLLESGSVEEAARLLDLAASALPDRQGLRVLAAHAHDRLGQSARALEHLAAVAPSANGLPTERMEYDLWPHGELDRRQDRLAKLGRASLVALGEAVAAGAPGLGGER